MLSGSWAGPGTDHTVFDKNQESVFHNFVPNTFSFFGNEGDREECTNFKKMVHSKYFLPFGSFSLSF